MTIDALGGASGVHAGSGRPVERKQTIDSEVFLQLLVTQLRNQDPSSPMDTNQMIAQSTQLAMMEQLTALARTGEESFSLQMRSTAAALIGQTVEYLDADGAARSGLVSSVSFAGAVPALVIDGRSIALDAVTAIPPVPGSTPGAAPGAA
ncbi:flagellar hook capping FlgD N-terminal domain-containing protein [Ruicaihuangia caeni]|uniref:flagellar hook capping FlgD N-terminal domain-containing protein n=1 Tax=Ruicaihuangia caeni TaxID=3042517 RepID=UPI00338EC149